ncbi:hypothetical protein N7495_006445 [Penicillium taxi]|uniref:uncharacterized protein n=1 Tax=Penicillium taxi TaxID=168475 RepID=UPI0025457400|nr:uncharacterized protein N7495_006445 [Penicillium taxi]KAJ5894754.1 hypothetical protein N7495_006445 [Penicillium taxi]
MDSVVFEKFEGTEISDEIIKDAAKLFSSSYGVWGLLAATKMGVFAKPGQRVRMSLKILKEQCLPTSNACNTYVRVKVFDKLAGNVFATRWVYEGRNMCWITQLCVDPQFRGQGLATKLLTNLREGEQDRGFGLLSSHPAAILAALRAFGRGPEEVDLTMTQEHAASIMASSPIKYVRTARLHGSIFDDNTHDGTVSCADTQFWVDHEEPLETLASVRANGIVWPFGELLEGHEFLIMVKAKVNMNRRTAMISSEF